MRTIQKATTTYLHEEDRIRITGAVDDGSPVVLWLTQRLLQRLVPTLTAWLETSNAHAAGPREIVQSYQQLAARQAHRLQPPVEAQPQSEAWIVTTVDYTTSAAGMMLVFKGADGQTVALVLSGDAMRQWLDIVHQCYIHAEWPLDKWPGWISPDVSVMPDKTIVRH